MFEYLNDLSIIVIENLSTFMIYDILADNKETSADKRFFWPIFIIYTFFTASIVRILYNNPMPKIIVIYASLSVFMTLYKKIKLKRSVVIALLSLVIALVSDFLVYFFLVSFFETIELVNTNNVLSGRLITLSIKLLVFIVLVIVKIITSFQKEYKRLFFEWIKFSILPIITAFAIIFMIVFFKDTVDIAKINVLYYIAFGMVFFDFFIFYLLESVIYLEKKAKNDELELAQYKKQIDSYNNSEAALENQRQKTHEFKNHITCINSMLKNGDYSRAEKYVQKLSQSEYVGKIEIDTNNKIIDTILTEKKYLMSKKDIVFVFKVNDLSGISMEDEDLVVLLSNLFDNAIEACDKNPGNKVIKFKFVIEEYIIVLSIRNTIASTVNVKEGWITTTKAQDSNEHGYGIKNIKKVINKYGGSYSIDSDEKEFVFSIIFPR